MTYEEMVSLLSGKIDLNEKTVERFKKYAALLKEWNEKMNLTAITDEPEIVEKHFYDCLLPTSHDLLDDRLICDLGTGAGFPGLVWKTFQRPLRTPLRNSEFQKLSRST